MIRWRCLQRCGATVSYLNELVDFGFADAPNTRQTLFDGD
jgi:hypothetical protein